MAYINGETTLWEYLTTYRNGHPIIMERIFTTLSYWLFGEINIKIILIVSSLFPILSSFVISYKEDSLVKKYFTHILLLSFTNSIFLWASASAVYFFPFFWFSLILLKLLPKRLDFVGLIAYAICLFLMFYSFSNSLVVLPVLVAYFFFQKIFQNKKLDFNKLFIFSIISIIFLRDYYVTTSYKSIEKVAMNDALIVSFEGVLSSIKFILVFCGSLAKYLSFYPSWQISFAMIFGLLLLLALMFHLVKYRANLNPWVWIGISIYLTGVMVAISRYDGSNYYYALDNRYEWFGVLNVLAVCHLLIPAESLSRKNIGKSLFLFLVFCLVGLKTGWNTLNLPRYKYHHESRASDFLNSLDNELYEIPFDTPNRALDALKVKPIMEDAEKLGLFDINPKYYLPRNIKEE